MQTDKYSALVNIVHNIPPLDCARMPAFEIVSSFDTLLHCERGTLNEEA